MSQCRKFDPKAFKISKNHVSNAIEDLSTDILLEIFGYLDGKSLKKSALVCKR